MDELTKHRKRRLEALIKAEPFLGNQSAFARRAELTKGRITQLIDPVKSFGERAGITMAQKLGFEDERYFEKDFGAEAPTEDDPTSAAVVLTRALRALAGADEATRLAVAPLFSLVATSPKKLEIALATVQKLLPPAHASKEESSPGLVLKGLGSGELNPDGQSVTVQKTRRRKSQKTER